MQLNHAALDRDEFVKKEVIRTFIIAPIETIFLFSVIYFTIENNPIILFIMITFLIMVVSLFFVYPPYLMIKRHNSTICELYLSNDNIKLSTFPILWLNKREYQMPISQIQFKKSDFKWYGKGTIKDGLTIIVNSKESLYLVKDYIDDYDVIKKELNIS